jgi:hypothetical protein
VDLLLVSADLDLVPEEPDEPDEPDLVEGATILFPDDLLPELTLPLLLVPDVLL